MTTVTSPGGGAETANNEVSSSFDRPFERVGSRRDLLSDFVAFQQILAFEYNKAGVTSALDWSAYHLETKPPLILPWVPVDAGGLDDVIDGLDWQNGTVNSKAGERAYAPDAVPAGSSARFDDAGQGKHHFQVTFEGNVYSTLKADYHIRLGQGPAASHGIGSPRTVETDDSITLRSYGPSSSTGLPANHVFYHGDGRPFFASFDDDYDDSELSLEPRGDKVILPDGAVFDYDPWTAEIDRLDDGGLATVMRLDRGLGNLKTAPVIEGELV